MRIDLNPGSGVNETQAERAQSGRSTQVDSRRTEVGGSAELDMSVGKLVNAALSAPEVRQARVQALKTQIEAGHYQVNAHHVAGSLIEQMRVRR